MGTKYYKKVAISALEGIWLREAFIILIYFFPFLAMELLIPGEEYMPQLIGSVILMPLAYGLTYHYLMIAKDEENGIGDLFTFYTSKEVFGLFFLNLVVGILVLLWSLLFIIPGIIASFAYTLAMYIKLENPDMEIMDCIGRSKDLMMGNKMKMFVLELSFFGWFFLSGLLIGFPLLWVMPYYMVAVTAFYFEIREDYNDEGEEQEEEIAGTI